MREFIRYSAVFMALGLIVAGCSSEKRDPFAGVGSPYYSKAGPLPKGGGHYQLGDPYEVAGVRFTPREQPDYDKTGIASWYGPQFHRRMTSNGEWFDMNDLTAAHATLPLPSYVKVTNLENGRSVVVRVNDRGPFVGTRIIDMSRRAAEVLGYKPRGTAEVRVQYIGPAPLDDQGEHLIAMNRELRNGTPLRRMLAAADRQVSGGTQIAMADAGAAPYPAAIEPDAVSENEPDAVSAPVSAPVITRAPGGEQATEYFVQVGSFADPNNARRARAEFANSGPVQVEQLMGSAGPLYRVRIGPMASEDEAQMALEQAVGLGHSDARLIMANAAL